MQDDNGAPQLPILGVGILLRGQGISLNDAIMQGDEKRVRPVTMTALTAILGLLPAALSTRIGAQTQQPLAIVVVGGMSGGE